jgi:hypothetical protein
VPPPGATHVGRERIVCWEGIRAWARCDRPMAQTAHVFRRHKLGDHATADGPPLVYHPRVALAACLECHGQFDGRQHRGEVRAPPAAVIDARRLVERTWDEAKARGERVVPVGLTNL